MTEKVIIKILQFIIISMVSVMITRYIIFNNEISSKSSSYLYLTTQGIITSMDNKLIYYKNTKTITRKELKALSIITKDSTKIYINLLKLD